MFCPKSFTFDMCFILTAHLNLKYPHQGLNGHMYLVAFAVGRIVLELWRMGRYVEILVLEILVKEILCPLVLKGKSNV